MTTLFSVFALAETTKTVFNPFTGKLDFITTLSSTTIPSGSTNYIQNTLTPTISTQKFNVQQGQYSSVGFVMTDSNGCLWDTTINTSGAIVTTFRPNSCGCSNSGLSIGLLSSLTYACSGSSSSCSNSGESIGLLAGLTYACSGSSSSSGNTGHPVGLLNGITYP